MFAAFHEFIALTRTQKSHIDFEFVGFLTKTPRAEVGTVAGPTGPVLAMPTNPYGGGGGIEMMQPASAAPFAQSSAARSHSNPSLPKP